MKDDQIDQLFIYGEGDRTFFLDNSGNRIGREGYIPGDIEEMGAVYSALKIAKDYDRIDSGKYIQETQMLLRDGFALITLGDMNAIKESATVVERIRPGNNYREKLELIIQNAISKTLSSQTEQLGVFIQNNLREAA